MAIRISYRNIIREGSFHPNGGGFVEDTTTVPKTVYVAPMAKILDKADVKDFCRIEGQAVVCEEAVVELVSIVSDHSIIQGEATITAGAKISGYSVIEGSATVIGGEYKDNVMSRTDATAFAGNLEGFESLKNDFDNNI